MEQSATETGQRIWAIGGGKGGVGKSLLATNLSIILAELGYNVVAIDLDLGNANMHSVFCHPEPVSGSITPQSQSSFFL